jgi:protein-tyrosine phosphatase
MDGANVDDLQKRFGQLPNLHKLLDFDGLPSPRDVPDPYYSDNFDYVYRLIDGGCRGLLEAIRTKEGLSSA